MLRVIHVVTDAVLSGDYHSSGGQFPRKRPSDMDDYTPDRKRHVGLYQQCCL